MAIQNFKNQSDPLPVADADEKALNPAAEEHEEDIVGINLPEQEPPSEIITPELKAEAAALEAFNLRPRALLPPHKLRAQEYPAKYPTPSLAEEFKNYHKKTLAAFTQKPGNKNREAKREPSWTDFLKKFIAYPRLRRLKRAQKTAHDQDLVMAYARQKRSVTVADVRILLGADARRAAGLLADLTRQNRLIRFGQEPDFCYKPKTY